MPTEAGSQKGRFLGFLSGQIFTSFVWISPSPHGPSPFLSGHGDLAHQSTKFVWNRGSSLPGASKTAEDRQERSNHAENCCTCYNRRRIVYITI